MANVSSSNTTTLYSTTQQVPIATGAPVSTGTVNDANFTTLYGQVTSPPLPSGNQIVNGNLLVTGSAQINQNLTVLGTTTLFNTVINGMTFPLTDGLNGEVLHTDGSGNLYWAVDDNVTYTIDASAVIGGANFNLVGSDLTTDTILFGEGTGVTITVPTANEIDIAIGQDVATTAGVTFDSVTLDNYLKINGATNGYSEFTAPATGSNLTYVLPGAAGAANTVLTNDGSGNLSWALPGGGGSQFGNITVGIVTDNTISTTTGDLILDSATNTVSIDADLTTPLTTFNLIDTTATTVNAFGAATTIDIGSATGTTTINNANTVIAGDLAVNGGDLTTTQTTFNLLDATATTVNAFGAATTIDIGSATGTTTINNANVVLVGDLEIQGGDLTTNQTTFNLLDATATTVNAFGAATTIDIGSATGTTTINNDLTIDGSMTIKGSTNGYSTFSAPATGSNLTYVLPGAAGAASTVLTNDGSGNLSWALPGGGGSTFGNITVGVATDNTISTTTGDLILDSATNTVSVDADLTTPLTTFNLINTTATTVNAFGAATTVNMGNSAGNVVVAGDLQVTGNDIKASTGNTNITLTDNTLTTFAGDIKVTGNDIQASDGNTNITMTSNTLTAFAGDIQVTGNDVLNSTGNTAITMASGASPKVTIAGNLQVTGTNIQGPGFGGTTIITLASLGNLCTFAGSIRVNGNNIQASDGNNNITMTSNTLTAFAGDIKVGGNDIQASDGNNNITMTSNTLTAFAGDIQINGNDVLNSTGNTAITMATGASPKVTIAGNLQVTGTNIQGPGFGGTTIITLASLGNLCTFAGSIRINGNNIQASDGNTNITLTSNTLTTFAGDIKVTGNDIQASDGNNNITMTSNTLTAFAGDIKVGGNDIQASDGNNNITMTSNTLTTFAGDIKVTGNDIQNSTGNNTITMAAGANALTTFAGDIKVSGNDIQNSAGDNNIQLSSTNTNINAEKTNFFDPNANSLNFIQFRPGNRNTNIQGGFQLFNYTDPANPVAPFANFAQYKWDTTGLVFVPTSAGESIGGNFFFGNSSSTNTVAQREIGSWTVSAAETITSTAWGGRVIASTYRIGTNASVKVIEIDTSNGYLRSNNWNIQDNASNNLVTINTSGNVTVTGDLAVNGGDLTTTAATATVFNTNATTVNAFGAGTAISIGSATGTTTINNDLVVGGSITYDYTAYSDNRLSTTSVSTVALDSWATATYQSASYGITVKDTTTGNVQMTKIDMFQAGGNAYINQYSNMSNVADLATFSATISGGNAVLEITPVSTNNTQFTFSRLLTEV